MQAPPEKKWRKWVDVLLCGVVLALLEIVLMLGWSPLQRMSLSLLLLDFLLCAFLYVIVPAFAGYFVLRSGGDASLGMKAGGVVGGFGLLVMAVALVALSIAIPQPSQPPPPSCDTGACGHLGSGYLAGMGKEITTLLVIIVGTLAIVGGMFGGWIGGNLARGDAEEEEDAS